jgi:hydrogenase nickel incorporation protein HypA/HybF
MHELAITENLLEIALRHAQTQNAQRITDLYLVIGKWSSFVDDSIQFYWDIISDGTIAHGSTLHFRRVPVVLICQDCWKEYQPTNEEFACPECCGAHAKVKAGDEFHLESIEVEN